MSANTVKVVNTCFLSLAAVSEAVPATVSEVVAASEDDAVGAVSVTPQPVSQTPSASPEATKTPLTESDIAITRECVSQSFHISFLPHF
jgi:hypothetical protein